MASSLRYLLISLFFFVSTYAQSCKDIKEESRLDCHPENGANEERCFERRCCWIKSLKKHDSIGVPSCFFPLNYNGYSLQSISKYEFKVNARLRRKIKSGLPFDVDEVLVQLVAISDSIVRIRITDANNTRFEPKLPILNIPKMVTPLQYSFDINSSGVLSIVTKNTNKPVFTTDLRRLIFSDQFIQLSSNLPSNYVYGLGEHKDSFRKKADWKLYTMFNRDQYPIPNSALYGSHPFYLTVDDQSKQTSAAFILNSNPMDVILTPAPSIVYRPIGGIVDLFVFVGKTPTSVISDYIKLIGLPPMPPLWGLGFHLCRFGYNSLENTIKVWNRTRMAKIPFDVQWNDIDYMDRHNDFTYNKSSFKGLPEFVDLLHKVGMHYVMIIDPGVSAGEPKGTYPPYDEGISLDVFIKNNTGNPLIGRVWNKSGKTVFPDFTHPNSTIYWTTQFSRYHSEVAFDGAWLDMNEISNFVDGSLYGCPKNRIENPPYVPGNSNMQSKGLCLSAKHYLGLQYNIHNLYSTYETKVTNYALRKIRPNKRPFIISRSTFPGQGHFGGHWSGDVYSSFEDMRYSIPSILNFNIFGVPLVGADICGFNGNTTVELCARWMSLGAFYPFARNHNTDDGIDQDPVALGEVVVSASVNALRIRYALLPYLYTLFYRAHRFGETVVRPLFFVFPEDKKAPEIETQFMWGSGLMIAPVLEPNVTQVNVYFPAGRWYSFIDSQFIESSGQFITKDAPLDKINTFVRGGEILIGSDFILQTNQLMDENITFSVIAVLNEENTAKGDLFWDDGESIDSIEKQTFNYLTFTAKNNTLEINPEVNGYKVMKILRSITVIGIFKKPNQVTINGEDKPFSYSPYEKSLLIFVETKSNIFSKYLIEWH